MTVASLDLFYKCTEENSCFFLSNSYFLLYVTIHDKGFLIYWLHSVQLYL